MTDHSPGSAADGSTSEEAAAGSGNLPTSTEADHPTVTPEEAQDGPPPRLSGQPGWSYDAAATASDPAATMPMPMPTPMTLPRQAEETQPVATVRAGWSSASASVSASASASASESASESESESAFSAHAPSPYALPPTAQPPADAWQRQGTWPELPPLPSAPTGGRPFSSSSGPRRRFNPLRPLGLGRSARTRIIAGGVALAAIAVTAVVLTTDDDGGGGTTAAAGTGAGADAADARTLTADWSLPGSAADQQVGTWVTDSYFVRATRSGVKAYKLSDGTPAWTARPLTGPAVPCAMSPTVSTSGIGTIGFGPDTSDCTTVVGVDTRTGKTLWSTPMTTKDHSAAAPTTTFLDGAVGVVVNDTVVGGVDLTDGHVMWGYKPRGQYCNAYPYGGAGVVLVDDYCADVSPSYVVTAFDAATGKEIWHRQGTDHIQFGSIVNAAPVVASLTNGTVNLYNTSGTPHALTLADGFDPNLGAAGPTDSGARTVGTTTLLLPSRQQTPSRAVITAVNTTTGATNWTYDGDGHQGAALVHPQQDTPTAGSAKIYAISLVSDFSQYSSPELVSLDPLTGRSTVLANLPGKPSSFVYTAGTVYALPDGRVLLVALDGTGTAVQMFK
ncbi:hypothetical protein ABH931_007635 [Streptacidiphilus sp. MAP12-33]|uniref:outer membrane protein assembly factor BamB family protein n=1 Tax=Streptacidiphilus sp. MAP12-33 TaxID=3156266 RepID=UPI0035123704